MAHPLPFRAVARDEAGVEFVDYLHERAAAVTATPTQTRALAERMWIFVQQYDHLRDDLGSDPTVEQYAERWRMPVRSAHRAFVEFAALFPGERDPGRVCGELWEGIGRQAPPGSLMAVGAVKVAAS